MSPFATIAIIEHGVLSPEASVKAFNSAANGYARGEAVNAIYIKKLDDAVRDSNPIDRSDRSSGSCIIIYEITVYYLMMLIIECIVFSLFLLRVLFFFVVLQPSFCVT
jgi:hypothetical protein